MKKFFQFAFVIFFACFFFLSTVLQTKAVRGYAKEVLIETIQKETGLTVEIEEIKLFPSFQARARNVAISDKGKRLIAVDHIHIGFNPIAFWKGYFHFYSLKVEKADIFKHSDSEAAPPLFTLSGLPFNLNINNFQINDAGFIDGRTNVETSPRIFLEGNLYVAPIEELVAGEVTLKPLSDLGHGICTELAYEKGRGTLHLKTSDEIEIRAEFLIGHENLLKVSHFHAEYRSYNVDGNLSLTPRGEIKESSFLFTTGELSEKLPITGYLYGDGKVKGSIFSPELDIQILSDELVFQEMAFRSVRGKVVSQQTNDGLKGRLQLSFVKDEAPYELAGKIYWDEKLNPFPTKVQAKTNLSELADIFNIETKDLEGDLKIELVVADNKIKARAILKNGRLESYQLGTLATDIYGILEGDLQKIELTELRGSDGNQGTFSALGTLSLDPGKNFPFELFINLSQVSLVQLDFAKAAASGEVTLTGNADHSQLEGTLTTDSVTLKIPEKTSEISPAIPIKYINLPSDQPPPTPYRTEQKDLPLALNINLIIPKNGKIEGQGLTSVWKGEAAITGTPLNPQVHGEFHVTEGSYKLRGRNLSINKGSITLAGDLEKKTSLYVIGETEIDRYIIEIIVKGPIKNTAISFRSNPSMTQREILSWLLFNKPASDISQFQGTQLNQSITSLTKGGDDGPDILTRFGNTLGVDRIDISGDPSGERGDVSVEVGKYLTDKTYVSYKRDISRYSNDTSESHRIKLNTNLSRNFKFQAEVDDDQNGQINLLWKKDY